MSKLARLIILASRSDGDRAYRDLKEIKVIGRYGIVCVDPRKVKDSLEANATVEKLLALHLDVVGDISEFLGFDPSCDSVEIVARYSGIGDDPVWDIIQLAFDEEGRESDIEEMWEYFKESDLRRRTLARLYSCYQEALSLLLLNDADSKEVRHVADGSLLEKCGELSELLLSRPVSIDGVSVGQWRNNVLDYFEKRKYAIRHGKALA